MIVKWTNITPGCVTTMMLPNGRQVALNYGDNEVSQEIYDDLIKYAVIKEIPKEIKSKHKEII